MIGQYYTKKAKQEDDVISDENWCVSAAALRFMHSIYENHFSGAEQHILPCCGHFMIAAGDLQTVEIYGCCNGIDFDVLHENDAIIIRPTVAKTYTIPFAEYRDAVSLSRFQQIGAKAMTM